MGSISIKPRRMDVTPLYIACQRATVSGSCECTVKYGWDRYQSIKPDDGWTPLYVACTYCGPFGSCECTVKYGWDRDQSSREEWMHTTVCCVPEGHLEVVNALLSTDGIDINQAEKYGSTPLWIACQEGPFGSCECTVKYGWDRYQSSQIRMEHTTVYCVREGPFGCCECTVK